MQIDRKSTRLNSSHLVISYAVFCLKKKIHHATVHVLGRGCVKRAVDGRASRARDARYSCQCEADVCAPGKALQLYLKLCFFLFEADNRIHPPSPSGGSSV